MKKFLSTLIVILVLVIGLEVGYLVYKNRSSVPADPTTVPTTETTQVTTQPTTYPSTAATSEHTTVPTEETTVPTTQAPVQTTAVTELPTEAPTEIPTEAPTEATEPKQEKNSYLLTFAGNCTLGNTIADRKNSISFVNTVGENYGYPFEKVQEYFKNDDFTMVNLEGVFSDDAKPIAKEYTFLGPSAYAKILSEGCIEAVSLANDHAKDFGSAGYADTKTSLDAEGISYVETDSSVLYTTDSGLKVGVYAVNSVLTRWDMQREIKQLKNKGAEVIVVFFHWGNQNDYHPSQTQIDYGHMAIQAGAHIVIGTNPHVLQPIEYYRNGIICYSLGNFSYGGAKWITDPDTAFVQLEVFRNQQGKIEIGDLYIIPCSITTLKSSQNLFQPFPVEVDSWQYNQVLRKLSEPVGTKPTEASPTGSGNTASTQPAQPTEPATQATTPVSPDVPDLYDPQA